MKGACQKMSDAKDMTCTCNENNNMESMCDAFEFNCLQFCHSAVTICSFSNFPRQHGRRYYCTLALRYAGAQRSITSSVQEAE